MNTSSKESYTDLFKESAINLFYDNLENIKVRGIFANGEKSPYISLNRKEGDGIIGALDDYDYDYMNVNQEFLNNAHMIEDNLTTHVNITDFLKPVVLSYHREKISAFTDEMIDKGAVAIEFTTTIK